VGLGNGWGGVHCYFGTLLVSSEDAAVACGVPLEEDMSTPIVSVNRMSQLELGAMYEIAGDLPDQPDIVPQVFRLEKIDKMDTSGNPTLTGTLWWRVWAPGWFSGTQRNHQIVGHMVNIQKTGATGRDQGKHGLHLERIEPKDVSRVLGRGAAYNQWLIDNLPGITQ